MSLAYAVHSALRTLQFDCLPPQLLPLETGFRVFYASLVLDMQSCIKSQTLDLPDSISGARNTSTCYHTCFMQCWD